MKWLLFFLATISVAAVLLFGDTIIAEIACRKQAKLLHPPGLVQIYSVQKGDTLSKIATRNHANIRALAHHNKLENSNKLTIGQVLELPTPRSSSSRHDSSLVADGKVSVP